MMDMNNRDMEPCRMADNFYHIGVEGGPSYLLETSEGIVLIDTAYPETVDMLLSHICKIGKDPRDIRHIIHSHGHYDHVGATHALVEISGAKTYIGAGDEDAVMGKNDLVLAAHGVFCEPFTPDVVLHDGDVLHFGDTEIRVVATPGHTMGTMSLFFPIKVNGKPYRAGMFGGAGLGALKKEYLDRYGLPLSMRDMYLQSIEKIAKEPVEFHVGNHLNDNNFYQKVQRFDGKVNPFVAENTYLSFLNTKKRQALEQFANDL